MSRPTQMKCSLYVRNDDFVVRDHRVHSVRIMPGVTFFDMIYRFLKLKDFQLEQIELRHILFKEPIATSPDFDKKVEIIFQKDQDFWRVVARSKKVYGDGTDSNWTENLACELHVHQEENPIQMNIEYLKKTAKQTMDMDICYEQTREAGIQHFEFMKLLGKVYEGDDHYLAEVNLSDLASRYTDYFYLHPAFLDGATCVPGILMKEYLDTNPKHSAPFIPMFVESFRAYTPLTEKCFVYVSKSSFSMSSSEDITYVDIEMFNNQGERLVSFKKLATKKVRSQELLKSLENSISDQPTGFENKLKDDYQPSFHQEKRISETDEGIIERELRRMIADIVHREPEEIHLTTGFYNQGLNSGDLLEIVQKLEKVLQTKLYPTLLFEYSNIKELSEYLKREYSSRIEEFMKEEERESVAGELQGLTSDLYFSPEWIEKPIQAMRQQDIKSPVLLFDEKEELFNHLTAKNIQVILVKRGHAFQQEGVSHFVMDLEKASDYKRLIQHLILEKIMPRQIVYVCPHRPSNDENIISTVYNEKSAYHLLYLAQALMGHKLKESINIIGMYKHGLTRVNPYYGALSAIARIIRAEQPKLGMKMIEIQSSNVHDQDMVSAILCQELCNELNDEINTTEIRYVEDKRFEKQLSQLDLASCGDSIPIRKQGVYLITGGLGGLGRIFAHYLAERYSARLILTGRTKTSAAIEEEISQLERLGAEVIYIPADVSQREDVQGLYEEIQNKFGLVHGIFHAAGTTKDALILHKTALDMEEVLAPKIAGTVHLDEIFHQDELDFMLLFSSMTALIGNVGQVDYAYANNFMDLFAEFRESLRSKNKRYGKTLSINWPIWLAGGMRTNEQNLKSLAEVGILPLSTEIGLLAFEKALSGSYGQVLVLDGLEQKVKHFLNCAEQGKEAQSHTIQGVKLEQSNQLGDEMDIAIIGMSGRYPMAHDLKEFWENLENGRDCITEIPKDRWDHHLYYHPEREQGGKSYSKWGGFLSHIDTFDPLFFNITPREAELLDPQERAFLECVWETIEDAGYTRQKLGPGANVGVFVGAMWGQYQLLVGEDDGNPVFPTSVFSAIANRVSYFFNFHGPSLAIDTMCSSSLTAIHLACESIKRGESEMAIAGGVNITLHPRKYQVLSQGQFLSSDGKCRSFGAGGDGYVPGEGVGSILLKPLSKAVKDRDPIYGVIKGSSLNHGGQASGYHVPNPNAQAKLIQSTLEKAKIDPRSISYVETHGTGTSLGDPIEHKGLEIAFRAFTKEKHFCALGSVKSNIGHLESAAGIAGITKILLQMKYKKLVPSLIHSDRLNENIDFEQSPFYVQQHLTSWDKSKVSMDREEKTFPRRACISSFGAGGANAHLIIEEFERDNTERETTTGKRDGHHLFILSAKNEERLVEYAKKVRRYLTQSIEENVQLEDIIYTFQVGRESMESRLAIMTTSSEDLMNKLAQFESGKDQIPFVFQGDIRNKQRGLEESVLDDLYRNKDLEGISKLWLAGVSIEWDKLYEPLPNIVSVPTYPFAPEKYWITESSQSQVVEIREKKALHPLIDRNRSTLMEQKYEKTLRGNEFYLEDHKINGKKTLPGVTYLEMGRAAGELAAERKVRAIKNLMLKQPIEVLDTARDVTISLYPTQENQVEFEISSDMEHRGEMVREIHASGELEYLDLQNEPASSKQTPFNIEEIRNRCEQNISDQEFYNYFQEVGIEYGPGFKPIKEISFNNKEVVAKLRTNEHIGNESGIFGLHPMIMDGTFQAVSGLMGIQFPEIKKLYYPFMIGELEIQGSILDASHIYVKGQSVDVNVHEVRSFTVYLLNQAGFPLLTINDFVLKAANDTSLHESSILQQDQKLEFIVPESSTDKTMMDLLRQIESGHLNAQEVDKLMEDLYEPSN